MEGMATDALWLVALVAAPLLGVALLLALVVGMLQAATRITEPTLAFVPKLAAVLLVLALLGGWMGDRVVDFAAEQWTGFADKLE